jgi:hypothetical protein
MPREYVRLANIDGMSDELYDALADAFKKELVRQGKSPNVSWDFWSLIATYQQIEEYENA